MEIKDIGYVLSLQRFDETKAIVKILSKQNGVCSGIIRNIGNKRNNIFFPGNLIEFRWAARLSEHAGSITGELLVAYSSILMQKYSRLLAVNSIFSLTELLFKEHEAVDQVYAYLAAYLTKIINQTVEVKAYIEFEIFLLAQAGYSLDFSCCAVTGATTDLIFVSPKSGRAVSAGAGKDYADKLLKLPEFLINDALIDINKQTTTQAFELTSYFFERYVFAHLNSKKYIKPRQDLIDYLTKSHT